MKTDLKTANCSDDFSGLGVGAALPCPWGSDWEWGLVLPSSRTCLGPARPRSLCSSVPSHLPRPLAQRNWGEGDSSKPSCQ